MAKKQRAGGAQKKAASTDNRKPKHSNDANRPSKGVGFQRDAATVRRLNMYKKRAVRDKNGNLIHQDLQSKELPSTRIQPDRRWFGNTRVIGQKQLESFRTEMASKVNDAYTVLLREKKLPLQLLEDPEQKLKGKQVRHNLLTNQPFQDTFGTNAKRKKPRMAVDSLSQLACLADERESKFEEAAPADDTFREGARDSVFDKGQSKRIWGELYKVLDSSDVIIQVLDARDPMGTRCRFLEQHVRKNLRHKHLLLLLNKCDLVPSWVTKRWLHYLSREFPTLAFHASITNPFGKGALLSLLRQLARLRSDKQAISVGFVGYPNVGKSSVINTLRTKKVCKTAPVPGETKVWQYITLMKRIFLIDCPGVVYNGTSDSESDIVLKGVVRIENLEDATEYVPQVLNRVKPEYLKRAYKIKDWADAEDFLTQLARASGKLLRGGDPDLNTAARMVLLDWQRGKIPFFTLPPDYVDERVGPGAAAVPAPVTLLALPAPSADAGVATGAGADAAAVQLPTPAGAVTEEDALQEAGARPEEATAAARAARELLSAAVAMQARTRIPVQQDYFMPEDVAKDGEVADDAAIQDEDVIASEDEDPDASEDDGEDLDENESEDLSAGAAEDEDGSSDAEDDDDVRGKKRGGSKPGSKRGQKRSAAAMLGGKGGADDGSSSGDDSDGYGDGGLSWETVLASVQGGSDQTQAAAAAQEEEDVKPTAKKSSKGASKRSGSAAAAANSTQEEQKQEGGAGSGKAAGKQRGQKQQQQQKQQHKRMNLKTLG